MRYIVNWATYDERDVGRVVSSRDVGETQLAQLRSLTQITAIQNTLGGALSLLNKKWVYRWATIVVEDVAQDSRQEEVFVREESSLRASVSQETIDMDGFSSVFETGEDGNITPTHPCNYDSTVDDAKKNQKVPLYLFCASKGSIWSAHKGNAWRKRRRGRAHAFSRLLYRQDSKKCRFFWHGIVTAFENIRLLRLVARKSLIRPCRSIHGPVINQLWLILYSRWVISGNIGRRWISAYRMAWALCYTIKEARVIRGIITTMPYAQGHIAQEYSSPAPVCEWYNVGYYIFHVTGSLCRYYRYRYIRSQSRGD